MRHIFVCDFLLFFFFFQAEDGIRDLVRSRGLGDVYKRQGQGLGQFRLADAGRAFDQNRLAQPLSQEGDQGSGCLLYTSDAADDLLCVDLGGRRIIKKKTTRYKTTTPALSESTLKDPQTTQRGNSTHSNF